MVMIAFFRGLKGREGKTSRFLRECESIISRFGKTRNKKNGQGSRVTANSIHKERVPNPTL